MRLSMIVVCLLLLSPTSVLACWKDAPEQTKWFQEMPSSSWEADGSRAEGTSGDGMLGPWLLGAGSASVALVGVSFRAFTRAAGRMPILEP